MDVIKRLAKEFGDDLENLGYTLEKVDDALTDKLMYINKTTEKLRFLSYLRDIAETKYNEHAPICPNPDSCRINNGLDHALYAINQQYDDYLGNVSDFNLKEKPAMQFFTDGQYFDAYTAIREILKVAKESIILIDAYVTADTLTRLPAKEPRIKLRILTDKKCKSAEFDKAIELYIKQYENLKIEYSKKFHDRFLIIDDNQFYHFGASLKDLGKKWFAFSKLDMNAIDIIEKL